MSEGKIQTESIHLILPLLNSQSVSALWNFAECFFFTYFLMDFFLLFVLEEAEFA